MSGHNGGENMKAALKCSGVPMMRGKGAEMEAPGKLSAAEPQRVLMRIWKRR